MGQNRYSEINSLSADQELTSCVELEDLLPCSQDFAIGPHADSGKSILSSHHTIYLRYILILSFDLHLNLTFLVPY
jgi:hypothetical protein